MFWVFQLIFVNIKSQMIVLVNRFVCFECDTTRHMLFSMNGKWWGCPYEDVDSFIFFFFFFVIWRFDQMTFSHIYDLQNLELYVNIYQVGVVTVCMCGAFDDLSNADVSILAMMNIQKIEVSFQIVIKIV